MERLITDTGGRPFKNEDALEYLQAFDIIEQWFGDLAFGDCIVYGCVISGVPGNYTVTAGVLYISGKLRLFDGVVGVAFPLVLKEETVEINVREYQEGVNKATAEQFKMVPDVGGAFNFVLATPRTRSLILGDNTITFRMDIGEWDMSLATGTPNPVAPILHGLIYANIVSVRAYIQSDAADVPFKGSIDFPTLGTGNSGGGVSVDATNVNIFRVIGEIYDSTQFDQLGGYNRGYIEIDYRL